MSDVISDSDASIQEKKACDGATVRGMCARSSAGCKGSSEGHLETFRCNSGILGVFKKFFFLFDLIPLLVDQ